MKNPIRPICFWFTLLAFVLPATPSFAGPPVLAGTLPIPTLSNSAVGVVTRFESTFATNFSELPQFGYNFSSVADGAPTINYTVGGNYAGLLSEGRLNFGMMGITTMFGPFGVAPGQIDSVILAASGKLANGTAYFGGYGDTPAGAWVAVGALAKFQATPQNGVGTYGLSGLAASYASYFPGGTDDSGISAISFNGTMMVGFTTSFGDSDPFYLPLPGIYPYVPQVPPGVTSGKATAVDAFGIVGVIDYPDQFSNSMTSGSIGIINYNSSTILPINLGKYPGSVATHSSALSWDASTIGGWYSDALGSNHPLIWKGNSFRDLGTGGFANGFAAPQPGRSPEAAASPVLGQTFGVTADGSMAVGQGNGSAFTWTATTGMLMLPNLNGEATSTALCVSSDGVFIGGASFGASGPGIAQLWTADGTTYNLQSLLTITGQDTTGWTLNEITAIVPNADKSYFICGYGTRNSLRQGFVVELDFLAQPGPTITLQPANQIVSAGSSAVFSVVAVGGTSYQWLKSGTAISGATSATLTLANVQAANAGTYAVVVTNPGGSIQSVNVSLTVNAAGTGPAFTSEPVSQTIVNGSTLVFSALASGSSPPSYQWEFNGVNISGATSSRLVLSNTAAANVGTYVCLATVSGVSATSSPVTFTLTSTTNVGRLINLSVNTTAGKSQVLTVGFVSGGTGTTGSENLLIRATGPALAGLGVPNTLVDPTLTVLNGQTVVASNDNWASPATNQTAVTAADTATFAFPLTNPASLDAAVAQAFAAGADTVQVSGNTAATGAALAEVYDNTPTASYTLATPRLINISAKNQIVAGGSMTAGFVVGGATSKTVLIRATGPALALLGVTGTIPDPQIALHTSVNGQDTVLATNAGWGGDPQITAASNSVFAFPLTNSASKDSVVLATLAPGSYTAIASSVSGTAGTVLIEVYEVP